MELSKFESKLLHREGMWQVKEHSDYQIPPPSHWPADLMDYWQDTITLLAYTLQKSIVITNS